MTHIRGCCWAAWRWLCDHGHLPPSDRRSSDLIVSLEAAYRAAQSTDAETIARRWLADRAEQGEQLDLFGGTT